MSEVKIVGTITLFEWIEKIYVCGIQVGREGGNFLCILRVFILHLKCVKTKCINDRYICRINNRYIIIKLLVIFFSIPV